VEAKAIPSRETPLSSLEENSRVMSCVIPYYLDVINNIEVKEDPFIKRQHHHRSSYIAVLDEFISL